MTVAQLQDHLFSLEERLFHPDRETDRSVLFPLLSPDYREFCTSGRIMNRQQVIDVMVTAPARDAKINHYYVVQLSETSALATYRATTPSGSSHRSSLWVLRDGNWQLVFHQGTPAN